MKASDLLKIIKDKPDFDIVLSESFPTEHGRPIGETFELEFDDIGYSTKVITLEKRKE